MEIADIIVGSNGGDPELTIKQETTVNQTHIIISFNLDLIKVPNDLRVSETLGAINWEPLSRARAWQIGVRKNQTLLKVGMPEKKAQEPLSTV